MAARPSLTKPHRFSRCATEPDRPMRSRSGNRFRAALLSLACLLEAAAAAPASAGPKEIATARRLFQEAEQHERDGRWADALAKLEQVAAIKETAGVRFHIATCLSHLGRLLEAKASFERARALAQEQKADDVLAMVDPQVQSLRRRIPVIRIKIPDTVSGAVVTVDGKPVGQADLQEIPVDPGTHQVIITVQGEARVDRYVKLAEGQSDTVEWREPERSTPKQGQSRPSSAPGAAASSRGVPLSAWVAMGGGALLGVGGYLAYRHADAVANQSAQVCARSISCDPARVDVVRKWDATALGLWIGAAAAVGTGVAIVVFHGSTEAGDVSMLAGPGVVAVKGTL